MKSIECPQTKIFLDSLLSRDDPESLLPDEEVHVAGCDTCRAQLEKVRHMEKLICRAYRIAEKEAAQVNCPSFSHDGVPSQNQQSRPMWESLTALFTWRRLGFAMAGLGVLVILAFIPRPGAHPPVTRGLFEEQVSIHFGQAKLINGKLRQSPPADILPGAIFGLMDGISFSALSPSKVLLHNDIVLAINTGTFSFNPAGIRILNGTIKVSVPKGKGLSFSTVTPSAVIAVRGTEYVVECLPDGKTTVSVIEGSVSVTNVAGEERILQPNDRVTVAPTGEFSNAARVTQPSREPDADHLLHVPQAPGQDVSTITPAILFAE